MNDRNERFFRGHIGRCLRNEVFVDQSRLQLCQFVIEHKHARVVLNNGITDHGNQWSPVVDCDIGTRSCRNITTARYVAFKEHRTRSRIDVWQLHE